VSGFLLTGLGLVFLFDKYLLHLLHWPPLEWRREISTRGASFLAGAVTFYLLRPGIVPLQEAIYRGFMVCLAGLLLERVWHILGWLGCGLLLVLLAVLVPWLAFLHPLHTMPKRTPVALGLAFEDVRFPSRDGARLAAWLIPHPSARGNVIYCHGHGRSCGQGAGLFTTLHTLGLNILAFDFRGHGASSGHTSTFGDHEVEDLLAAVHYLQARFPNQPLFLIGTSLGAAVILQALPQIPDVSGVWSEAAFSRLSHTVEHQFAWLPGPLRWPLVRGYYVLGWLDCGLWIPSINPVQCLDGLTVPIFFCHGQKDRLVPFAEAQELHDAYAGPKWHWWVKEGVHYNIRQIAPEEYLARLQGFVEECLKSACGNRVATPLLAPR
jgi:pimeloyl-ACP methyl ester carboxylesterase